MEKYSAELIFGFRQILALKLVISLYSFNMTNIFYFLNVSLLLIFCCYFTFLKARNFNENRDVISTYGFYIQVYETPAWNYNKSI